MPLQVIGIDHVQIAVPKALETSCVAFYRNVLGLSEISKPSELLSGGGAWFQIGELQLHIGIDPEPSPKSKRHVCFLVADLTAAEGAVIGHGVAIEERSTAEGLVRFFIRDPAGNRLEIGQRI
jgi:catechol 2,3-dioxygenase-like lactoylglutathione lyase family enzyme